MDKTLIRHGESVSLSADDILKITDNRCDVMVYTDLHKITDINQLFENKDAVVILYQAKENYGHFISLLKHSDHILEFFDPYGFDIDEELKFSEFNIREHEGQLVPHLKHLIDNSGYQLIVNKQKLQQFKKDVNTCGRWCAVRIKFLHLSLAQFINLMTKNRYYDGDFFGHHARGGRGRVFRSFLGHRHPAGDGGTVRRRSKALPSGIYSGSVA